MSENLSPDVLSRLRLYHQLLLKWQRAVNLVAPSTLPDAWNRHFEDSLQVLACIPVGAKVLVDIGSGAGFPGLVIAIARPELEVHLVESDQKKCTFLLNVSRETGAKNVNVHSQRIESIMQDFKADVVTARALAALPQLLAYTRPQWERAERPATHVFLKGADWPQEVALARQDYVFQVADYASKTNRGAAILCISDVHSIKKT